MSYSSRARYTPARKTPWSYPSAIYAVDFGHMLKFGRGAFDEDARTWSRKLPRVYGSRGHHLDAEVLGLYVGDRCLATQAEALVGRSLERFLLRGEEWLLPEAPLLPTLSEVCEHLGMREIPVPEPAA